MLDFDPIEQASNPFYSAKEQKIGEKDDIAKNKFGQYISDYVLKIHEFFA